MSKKLETAFADALKKHGALINANLKIASDAVSSPGKHANGVKALAEATALADKSGIPFYTNVVAIGSYLMPTANQYVPNSYFEKYKDLDPKIVSRLTQVADFALKKTPPVDDGDFDDDPDGLDDYYESSEYNDY